MPCSTRLTEQDIRSLASNAGFTGSALDRIVKIALAESGGCIDAEGVNNDPNVTPLDYLGSVDRGILQFNDRAWPQYSSSDPNSCAYDPVCAFRVAFQVMSKGGTYFGLWSTNAGIDSGQTGGGSVTGTTMACKGFDPICWAKGVAGGVGSAASGVASGLGFLTDPIGYLRKAFVTPFETVGIFMLGIVTVMGGFLIMSKTARGATVNIAKGAGEASVA